MTGGPRSLAELKAEAGGLPLMKRKQSDDLLLEAHLCLVGAGDLFRSYAEKCKASGGQINAADLESIRASVAALDALTNAIQAIERAVS